MSEIIVGLGIAECVKRMRELVDEVNGIASDLAKRNVVMRIAPSQIYTGGAISMNDTPDKLEICLLMPAKK